MNTFLILTIIYLISVILGISSITIMIIMKVKRDGYYERLSVLLLAVMVAFVISDYFCFRLPHYVDTVYSEAAGHMWGWVTDLFFCVIIVVWILILGKITGKGTFIPTHWLCCLFAIYTNFVAVIQHFILSHSLTAINFFFNACIMAYALYYLILSIRYFRILKPKGLSLILSALLLGYISFVSYGDFRVNQSLYQGNLPEVPVNLIVEILIVLDIVIIIYLIKADPLEIRQTDSDVQRLASLCSKFSLTERESDVMAMICQGKSNPQIAEALFISESTVKRHLTSIYHKTGTTNRYELIVLFCQDSEVR